MIDDDDYEQKRLFKLLRELRTDEDNEEFRNKLKEDKLDKFVNDDNNVPDLETEEEAAERIAKTSEMFKNKEDEFNKRFKDKENELSTKLNKLNNDVKKIYKYIIILKKVMIKK